MGSAGCIIAINEISRRILSYLRTRTFFWFMLCKLSQIFFSIASLVRWLGHLHVHRSILKLEKNSSVVVDPWHSRRQQKSFFAYYFLKVHLHHFSQDKKSYRSHKTVGIKVFLTVLLDERRIRICNTKRKNEIMFSFITFFVLGPWGGGGRKAGYSIVQLCIYLRSWRKRI